MLTVFKIDNIQWACGKGWRRSIQDVEWVRLIKYLSTTGTFLCIFRSSGQKRITPKEH